MQAILIMTNCPNCGASNRMVLSDRNSTHPLCGRCGVRLFEKFAVIFGYVYLLSNPAMPNLVKIGHTKGGLKRRVDQLNSATGVPKPFEVEAYFASQKPRSDEERIHSDLSSMRAPGREFFGLSPGDALAQCKRILGRETLFVHAIHGEFREP